MSERYLTGKSPQWFGLVVKLKKTWSYVFDETFIMWQFHKELIASPSERSYVRRIRTTHHGENCTINLNHKLLWTMP